MCNVWSYKRVLSFSVCEELSSSGDSKTEEEEKRSPKEKDNKDKDKDREDGMFKSREPFFRMAYEWKQNYLRQFWVNIGILS